MSLGGKEEAPGFKGGGFKNFDTETFYVYETDDGFGAHALYQSTL